jgi:hypothetical protein
LLFCLERARKVFSFSQRFVGFVHVDIATEGFEEEHGKPQLFGVKLAPCRNKAEKQLNMTRAERFLRCSGTPLRPPLR